VQRQRERPSLNVPTLGLALLLVVLACNGRTPQAAFDQANRAFLHGDLAAAEEQAKKGYRDFHELGADWAWKFRILEADVLMWRGLSQQVPPLFASEATPTPAGDLTIHKYRLAALANVYEHRFQEAENDLHEAEKSCTTFRYSPCVEVISAWGGLEMERGHFVEAQRRFEQTLSLLRDDSFLEANALSSLGWSALQQEHFDEAIEWASRSYEQSAAIGASAVVQASLGNMGWAYYRLGEHERALSMFIEAQRRAHDSGITTDEVQWLTNAGYVYLDAGDYVSAERSYLQALELAKDTGQEDRLNVLMSLALVCERTGKLKEARDYADRTIALASPEGNPLDRLYPMLVKGHVAARMHDTQQAEKIYREIEQDPKSHVFLKWEAEHSLAQLYEDENQPQSADREYRAALSTFETARSSLKHEESELPFPSNALGIYDDYIHFLASQGKTAEALQVAEYSRGRTLAEGLGLLEKGTTFKPVALNPQEIARRARGTILFYWLGEKQSYLWVVTAQKTSLFTLPPKSEIDPVVRRYRKALSEQQEFLQTADDDARMLYRTLVMPAKPSLAENAKVIIIPDGSLNTLNFETLLVPDPAPHYWIEDVTIADANSLRLLTVPRSADSRNPSLLLLGNAVAPNTDYPELRKAAAEMESIAKNFPQPRQSIFARDSATPTAYLSGKPEQFSYIHFVAHGTASRTSPLDSAIVLSKSGPEDDSFKLYARDIIHHPLHAELVTISTCYGAGSRAYTGEGLVGLSWAFLRAGAHNVIGALWEVSDVSTPQLMDELYGELAQGKTPDTALRNAKLKLLRSSTAFRKPFYWAPFQLYTGS
jgi:CHAT domain-containing protein/Tfp pilus assembly protein PilF